MYLIGDFSKITKLSIRTLRYYHEIGLLYPAWIDPESGYRYYDESCMKKARLIYVLRSLDFSLDSIQEILRQCSDDTDIVSHMRKKLDDIKTRLLEYTETKNRIEAFLTLENQTYYPSMETSVKEIPDIFVAFCRFSGEYRDINHHIEHLCAEYGEWIAGSPFALYYDHDSVEENADIEVCVPITPRAGNEKKNTRMLKGHTVISMMHKGGYDSIFHSYRALVDYAKKNNLIIMYPSREIYHRGRGQLFDRMLEEYLTEIQFPIQTDKPLQT